MIRKLSPLLIVLVLALVTLACGLFGGDEPAITEEAPAETSPPAEAQTLRPTDVSEAPAASEVALGDEYRSEEGGFAFLTIPGYSVQGFFGLVSMEAPGADPETGPAIVFVGSLNEESATVDELYEDLEREVSEDESAQVQISNEREITIGGVTARAAELSGTLERQEVAGRVVVAMVTPTQEFKMLGLAPRDRWEELSLLFDAVLASVHFFAPAVDTELPTEEPGGVSVAPAAPERQPEEIRQWAIAAVASSEYGNPDWAASQATRAPDTIIEACDDLPTAWAPYESDTVEWIELTYGTPVVPTGINIIETHSPDQVVKVELVDVTGAYHEVYSSSPVDRWEECPYTLSIPVEVDYQVARVRITIDQSVISTPWNEIDAVELVGLAGSGESAPPPGGTEPPSSLEDTLSLQDPPIVSEAVESLTVRLKELGYEICEVSVFFGAQTESAVKRFQEVNGLSVDGIVGPETWERLFSESAIPAPPLQAVELELSPPFPVNGGRIASDGQQLWVLSPGFHFVEAFDPDTEEVLVGMFSISMLPGEEGYLPEAIAFDGSRLWVASLGEDDAILQAYDPETSPVVGELTPLLAESIHIAGVLGLKGMVFAGSQMWVATEGYAFPSSLVPVDPETGMVGEIIEFGMETFVNAPAFDGERLWVPIEGYYGQQVIRPVDPASGEIGEPLGVCGSQVAYDGAGLWVAKEGELWVVDPYNGEVMAKAPLEVGPVKALIFYGSRVWVLGWDGSVQYYVVW